MNNNNNNNSTDQSLQLPSNITCTAVGDKLIGTSKRKLGMIPGVLDEAKQAEEQQKLKLIESLDADLKQVVYDSL